MASEKRNLLQVLKTELEFLEKGGYARQQISSWRAPFIFEDSPTCFRRACRDSSATCADCVLMPLVPRESRGLAVPCRYIPLNEQGEDIQELYNSATQTELEWTLDRWLRSKIKELEEVCEASRDRGPRLLGP